jgi:hypothetical protein
MLTTNSRPWRGARDFWMISSSSMEATRMTVCDFRSWIVEMPGSGLCPLAVASSDT